jgi:acylphosphatase
VKAHLNIRVHGLVQGVNFRQAARREALRLGLTGFARNEPDGTVLIEVEGEPAAIEEFVRWCRHGPPAARVDRLETWPGPVAGHQGFARL